MNMFILTEGQKQKFWIVDVIEPADVKITPGKMTLTVDVKSYKRSLESASMTIIEEQMKHILKKKGA